MTLEQMAAMVAFHRTDPPADLVEWAAAVLILIDEAGFKYVNRAAWSIRTRPGYINIPRATLSDGTSGGGPDRCPRAYWPHDALYRFPYVVGDDGKLHRLNRFQCDAVYVGQLARAYMPVDAAASFVLLTLGGGRAWRRYKRLRKTHGAEWLLDAHALPCPQLWTLPSDQMIDIQLKPNAGARLI